MKKILSLIVCLAFGGCTSLAALTQVATATVPATDAIVAGNSFDAIEAGGTGFLTYCHTNKDTPATCSAANRRTVIKATRSGRTARNQVEMVVAANCPVGATVCTAPVASTLYNSLVAAVTSLKASPAANFVGAQ